METRELIIEKLNNGNKMEKESMLRACETSIVDLVERDIAAALEALRKVDPNGFDEETKKRFNRLYSKVYAIKMICDPEYDCIDIIESQGLKIMRDKSDGHVVDIKPNGKHACQIMLWSGMDKFEIDPDKLRTEETC